MSKQKIVVYLFFLLIIADGCRICLAETSVPKPTAPAATDQAKPKKTTYVFLVAQGNPNILTYFCGPYSAQPRQTTKLEIKASGSGAAGKQLQLSVTGSSASSSGTGGGNGLLSQTTVTLDKNSYASVIFSASTQGGNDARPATLMVHLWNNGVEVSRPVNIYFAPFNFTDLTNNPNMAGYTDKSYVDGSAMSAAAIQLFLKKNNSGLQNFSQSGYTAAQIISKAAIANGINPKLILVTLQKEQGLITDATTYPANSRKMKWAMGCGSANSFMEQINCGAQSLKKRFVAPAFKPIAVTSKYSKPGVISQAWANKNILYALPETNSKDTIPDPPNCAAVQFTPANKSTMAQYFYTNYVISYWPQGKTYAGGGVYLFNRVWQKYFPQ
ncbi:MAG TPA: hypothetical protein VKJ65_12160 [Phycisphaerae bacterium]|nr:hypothetical protein [Phycisphaerae bacterium]